MRDLYVDTQYEFRVSAENKAGCGQPSLPSTPVVTRDPWGRLTVSIIVKIDHKRKIWVCAVWSHELFTKIVSHRMSNFTISVFKLLYLFH